MTLDVLLLSAGLGTRLRPLTEELPKALLPFHGTPLLDLHLDRLAAAHGPDLDFGRVVVNTHHMAERIATHLEPRVSRGEVTLSHEERILGTGGAIAQAAPHLESDPFMALNCDALAPPVTAEAVAFHQREQVAATLLLARSTLHPNVICEAGRIRAILRDRTDPRGLTYTGCCLLSRSFRELIPGGRFFDIRDAFDELLATGGLGGWVADDDPPLLDLGTPARYLDAHRICPFERIARYGFRPDAARIRRPRGYGFIDRLAVTEEGCLVQDSLVLAGAHVAGGARVERSILGPDARVAGRVSGRLVTCRGSAPLID